MRILTVKGIVGISFFLLILSFILSPILYDILSDILSDEYQITPATIFSLLSSLVFTAAVGLIIYRLDQDRRNKDISEQKIRISILMYNIELYCSRLLGNQSFALEDNLDVELINTNTERNIIKIDDYVSIITRISIYFKDDEAHGKIMDTVLTINNFMLYYVNWDKKIRHNNTKIKELTRRRQKEFKEYVEEFSRERKELDKELLKNSKKEKHRDISVSIKEYITSEQPHKEPSHYRDRLTNLDESEDD
jgi:hypothetical protein